jgi:hypothetical protein
LQRTEALLKTYRFNVKAVDEGRAIPPVAE